MWCKRGAAFPPVLLSRVVIIITTIVITIIVINIIVINIAIISILIILNRSHQFYQWINLTLIMQVLRDRENPSILFFFERNDPFKFGSMVSILSYNFNKKKILQNG